MWTSDLPFISKTRSRHRRRHRLTAKLLLRSAVDTTAATPSSRVHPHWPGGGASTTPGPARRTAAAGGPRPRGGAEGNDGEANEDNAQQR